MSSGQAIEMAANVAIDNIDNVLSVSSAKRIKLDPLDKDDIEIALQ